MYYGTLSTSMQNNVIDKTQRHNSTVVIDNFEHITTCSTVADAAWNMYLFSGFDIIIFQLFLDKGKFKFHSFIGRISTK